MLSDELFVLEDVEENNIMDVDVYRDMLDCETDFYRTIDDFSDGEYNEDGSFTLEGVFTADQKRIKIDKADTLKTVWAVMQVDNYGMPHTFLFADEDSAREKFASLSEDEDKLLFLSMQEKVILEAPYKDSNDEFYDRDCYDDNEDVW